MALSSEISECKNPFRFLGRILSNFCIQETWQWFDLNEKCCLNSIALFRPSWGPCNLLQSIPCGVFLRYFQCHAFTEWECWQVVWVLNNTCNYKLNSNMSASKFPWHVFNKLCVTIIISEKKLILSASSLYIKSQVQTVTSLPYSWLLLCNSSASFQQREQGPYTERSFSKTD